MKHPQNRPRRIAPATGRETFLKNIAKTIGSPDWMNKSDDRSDGEVQRIDETSFLEDTNVNDNVIVEEDADEVDLYM